MFPAFRVRPPIAFAPGYFGGGDLSLELVVELLQRLLFANGVLAVESRLFSVAIQLGLLLLYVSEHLKNQAFV